MSAYIDPHQVYCQYRLNHITLDIALRKLKERIDLQFDHFRQTLIMGLNNLNFLRYHQNYPGDDIKFIFKQKTNISTQQSRLEQKEEIMRRMMDFSLIRLDSGGIADNCIWEIQQLQKQKQSIIDLSKLVPSANTFLHKNGQIIKKFNDLWKLGETGSDGINGLFKDASPLFSRTQINKLGVIFSQFNKRIVRSRLIFRASQFNFQSALFKENCAGVAPTLLIAKSDKGKLFGGFTPAKWLNSKEKEYVGDPSASSFLFSLDNTMVFPIKKNQLDYAISSYGVWGPIYGSPYGPDLSISDKCHANDNSCSSLGSHYDIPINIKEHSQEAYSLLAGAKKFRVVEYQIYHLQLQ